MPFWQRLVLTIVVMLVTGYVAGLLWQQVMSFPLPSYAAGAIGGLAALPRFVGTGQMPDRGICCENIIPDGSEPTEHRTLTCPENNNPSRNLAKPISR